MAHITEEMAWFPNRNARHTLHPIGQSYRIRARPHRIHKVGHPKPKRIAVLVAFRARRSGKAGHSGTSRTENGRKTEILNEQIWLSESIGIGMRSSQGIDVVKGFPLATFILIHFFYISIHFNSIEIILTHFHSSWIISNHFNWFQLISNHFVTFGTSAQYRKFLRLK